MKILVLGADGMIGHCIFKYFRARYDVKGTLHNDIAGYQAFRLFSADNVYPSVDVVRQDLVIRVMEKFEPDVVINATGIVKQRVDKHSRAEVIEVNALVPHRLAAICALFNARLIQFSTDCVFSGERGSYSETDVADAEDDYGRTKYLGEVLAPNCLTIRTSSIGLEIGHCHGLVEWFLRQTGTIRGFTRAIYSGITTIELARIVEFIIINARDMDGLWQVASEPMSKYRLLSILKANLGRTDVEIDADDSFACDRSLQGGRFQEYSGYKIPRWRNMLRELAETIMHRANEEEA